MATVLMAAPATLAVLLLSLSIGSHAEEAPSRPARLPKVTPGKVIELGEANFDIMVQKDVWLVDVYATWCSHCRQLEPVWNSLAQHLKDTPEIHVAKVDGPRNKALMSQLRVEAFPSIYMLRDGRMWLYSGPRNSDALVQFATKGYKSESPLPPHRCPNHVLGRLVGQFYRMPGRVKNAYKYLREDYGWSDLTILVAVLGVPVVSGVCTICLMDSFYLRKARRGDEDDMYDIPAAQPEPAPLQ